MHWVNRDKSAFPVTCSIIHRSVSQFHQYKNTAETSGLPTIWPAMFQPSVSVCVCECVFLCVCIYGIMRLDSCRHEFPAGDIKMREEQWIILTVLCLLYITEDIKEPVSDGATASCTYPEWGLGRRIRLQRHLWEFPESPEDVQRDFQRGFRGATTSSISYLVYQCDTGLKNCTANVHMSMSAASLWFHLS